MLLTGALIGAGWFGLFAVGHAIAVVWGPPEGRSRAAVRLLVSTLVGAAMTATMLPVEGVSWTSPDGHRLVAVAGALVTLGCGFILWMPAYYVVVSSISGQILTRLDSAPDGRLRLDALDTRATGRKIVGPRLTSMVRSGLLVQDGSRYRTTAHGRRTARLFRALKSLWRL